MGKRNEDIESDSKVSIDDFVITKKVDAFCDGFTPAKSEKEADIVFTDAKLRKYFQAYPRNIGDPLIVYVDLIAKKGFHLQTSIIGEPAIFVKHNHKSEYKNEMDSFLLE